MKFSDSFLDEIRARLPVSQVVSRRVPLKRAGREWKGLSPFNKEKTPSFTVNDQKGFYHDFSSGKHGVIFTFVIPLALMTTYPAEALLGRLSLHRVVGVLVGAVVLALIARLVWLRSIRGYTSAS